MMIRICRFRSSAGEVRIGLISGDSEVSDLAPAGFTRLQELLERDDAVAQLSGSDIARLSRTPLAQVTLLAPVEEQEVWAAGVTYWRSRAARMGESDFGASAYDKVYAAPRPELFFKAMPHKVAGPGDFVGIRRDAKWNVPEPELALVLNSKGQLAGVTIGNDMSSRDIEGENLLYLPQAKIYDRSCALGPWIQLGVSESEARLWSIHLNIRRGSESIFTGQTSISQIKRSFEELTQYLFRSQAFRSGAVLLTGTGVIPQDDFTLRAQDEIEIGISGIGVLRNSVTVV